jgi:hypothetical protein
MENQRVYPSKRVLERTFYISELSMTMTKYLRQSTYKEGRFIVFRRFRSLVDRCQLPLGSYETVHHSGTAWWPGNDD